MIKGRRRRESQGSKGDVGDGDPCVRPAPLAVPALAVCWRGISLISSKPLRVAHELILVWLLASDDFALFALAIMPLDLAAGPGRRAWPSGVAVGRGLGTLASTSMRLSAVLPRQRARHHRRRGARAQRQPAAATVSLCIDRKRSLSASAGERHLSVFRDRVLRASATAARSAALEWVVWFHTSRLLEPLGSLPPADMKPRITRSTRVTRDARH